MPYACAVRVEELVERGPDAPLYIRGEIFVERASQKGIVIGEGGAMLKRIGQAARRELEPSHQRGAGIAQLASTIREARTA